MQNWFTVVLQNGMHFSVIWLIIAAVLAAAAVLLWIWLVRLKKKAIEDGSWNGTPVKTSDAGPTDSQQLLKSRYLQKLQSGKAKYQEGKINARIAAQEISLLVRSFVFDATGKPVHLYTLRDIEKKHLKELGKHVRLLYEPEFAPEDEKEETVLKLYEAAERFIKRF